MHKHERNQTYSDTAIQCCLMIKSLFRLSLRMVTGFVQSLIKLCGLNWTAPDYSTLCRRQKHIDIAISYQKSRDGLHLLVNSTGLKFLGEGEWKRKKHQPEYRRQWRKLYIDIDAETLQIPAVQLTKNNVRDSQLLGDLLDQIPPDERICIYRWGVRHEVLQKSDFRSSSTCSNSTQKECQALERF